MSAVLAQLEALTLRVLAWACERFGLGIDEVPMAPLNEWRDTRAQIEYHRAMIRALEQSMARSQADAAIRAANHYAAVEAATERG